MTPMDPKVKAEWVAALRSDEYTQGTGYLSAAGNHCCLGVLCEIAVRYGVIPPPETVQAEFAGMVGEYREYEGLHTTPPNSVRDWAGLNQGGVVGEGPPLSVLINMNDSGESFEDIAEYIEKRL